MKKIRPGIKILLSIVAAVLGLFVFTVPAFALPYISSSYYCLVDGKSGQAIVSRQADVMRPVASTTKMMTAILTVEYASPDEITVVSQHAGRTPQYSIGLRADQKILVSELLKVALIRSANDASVVLAEHVAGDEQFFAHLMSKKAFAIGAANTHFRNASGLPATDHYSTAYDLAQIGRYLLNNDYLRSIVATRQTTFKHPGYQQPMIIQNTNTLLDTYSGADGIKTGTTNAAGKCLVASATRNKRQLIAVSLKSGDRRNDCATLLEYGFANSRLTKVIDKSIPFKQLHVTDGRHPSIEIYPAEDIYLWKTATTLDIQKTVKVDYIVSAPVYEGQKLGSLTIYVDQKPIVSTDLLSHQQVDQEKNLLSKFLQNLRPDKRISCTN
jgi:D-alanyl-D-alanine carboxypeptidase (penicillin-binding protein 5/6)